MDWGRGRASEREIIYLSLHCHHQNDSCIKMGSDESHFNVSLIVRDKVKRCQCPQTTTFEDWERRAEAVSNGGPSRLPAYRLTARPNRLSKKTLINYDCLNSRKKYGAAGHYFHSCANNETTDHYLQSRCANKNPRATIRTAALPIRIHVSLICTAALRIATSELASYEITHLCYMLGWTLILSVYFFGFSANMLHQQNTDHIFFPEILWIGISFTGWYTWQKSIKDF